VSPAGDPLFDLSGRAAVVTGGMGQLGAEYAAALSERGMRVAILDVVAEPKPGAADLSRGLSEGSIRTFAADVTDREIVEGVAAEIEASWGVPHLLVNNAAIDAPPDAPAVEVGPFETYPLAAFDRVMDVNVKGTLVPCQVFGAAMARARRGSIINVSSVYGLLSPVQELYDFRRREGETFVKPVSYSVSKSAILNLTRYLATYWAADGVRVNTLTLAGVSNEQPSEFVEAYTARVPLGRMLEAREAVGAVVFLAADASSYVTGANVVVDGGWSAW
jgi:NAD(P)-dependent dehydrogenase (short-subunit alcohol dehydrogenase family)